MDEDPHLSQIQTLWSVVELAHGDDTAMQSAQQKMLDRYGGAVRRYALAALRDEDAADEVFQEFALKFVRGDFRAADPGRGRFRAFVKTVVYRLIVDYQRRRKKLGREGQMHSNLAEPGERRFSERGRRTTRCSKPVGATSSWPAAGASSPNTNARAASRITRCCATASTIPEARSPELAEGLSKSLGKPINAGAVRVLLHRSRDAFADLLFEEVTNSLADGSLDAAEQELIELDLLGYCKPALERRREKK